MWVSPMGSLPYVPRDMEVSHVTSTMQKATPQSINTSLKLNPNLCPHQSPVNHLRFLRMDLRIIFLFALFFVSQPFLCYSISGARGIAASTSCLAKLESSLGSKYKSENYAGLFPQQKEPPSLVSLCLGALGRYLEDGIDIIPILDEIAAFIPAEIKMAILAIARRRKSLNDEVLRLLADPLFNNLDVSGSDVSDFGLLKVAEICQFIRALDISRCTKITDASISELLKHCRSLETLRCGGCPVSDRIARRILNIFKLQLNSWEVDSWEELDMDKIITGGAQSLRWLVWPDIDKNSSEYMTAECPRIAVNPKDTNLVPREALPHTILDETALGDVDPKIWAIHESVREPDSPSSRSLNEAPSQTELSAAERFI